MNVSIIEEIKKEEKEILDFIRYEEKLIGKFFNKFVKKLLAWVIRMVWVGEVKGLENIPMEGPAIIALNHSSYFDFLCLSAILKRPVHFLAAEKFFSSPFWAPLMHLSGQIKVDRNKADKSMVYKQVLSALKHGRLVGIFPEGTRAPNERLLKAYTGVAKIALSAKVPIIPIGIVGAHKIMSKHHMFPRLARAHFYIGVPLIFSEVHHLEHEDKHYRMVTDTVMHKIAELSGKKYEHAEYEKIILD